MKNLFLLLFLPVMLSFSTCSSCPEEMTTLYFVTDADAFVRSKANNIDATFSKELFSGERNSWTNEVNEQYLSNFLDALEAATASDSRPSEGLARYFQGHGLNNAEIKAGLQAELERSHLRNIAIIKQRLDHIDSKCLLVTNKEGALGFEIQVEKGMQQEIMNTVQQVAKIKFKEVYSASEAHPWLYKADEIYAGRELGTEVETEIDSLPLEEEEVEELEAGSFEEMVSGASVNPKRDSEMAIENEKLRIEFMKNHKILSQFNLTVPMIPESGELGYAKAEDTARIMSYISDSQVAEAFPSEVEFVWAMDAVQLMEGEEEWLSLYAMKKPAPNAVVLEGKHIEKAYADFNEQGFWAIMVNLDEEGAVLFENLTKKNKGRPLGIVYDKWALSVPLVNGVITGGSLQISGNFTMEETKELAELINGGALACPIRAVQ